jgi:MFS family permease
MSPRAIARRTFRSLRVRNYRLYFFGQIVSMSGTWMQNVAQMWLVFQLTGSGVALGITSALQFVPVLFFGAWGGLVADRVDKRKVLIGTQAASATLAATLCTLTAAGAIELWMIYGLALALGFVTVVEVPVRQSFVIEMVGPDELGNAVGLNSTVFTSARVLGPAMAAILISSLGIAWCFGLNAISYLAVIAGLRAMDTDELRTVPRVPHTKGQLREGLTYVWRHRELRTALGLMAVVGTLAFNFRVLLPMMAERVFQGGAGTYGALATVMGIGTVFGALLVAGRGQPSRRMLIGSAFAYGALICIAAIAPNLATEMIVLAPMGAAGIAFVATANSTLQLASSDSMRGRVMALYSVVFLGSTPIGGPIVGWVAEWLGVRAGFLVGGVSCIVAALWVARKPLRARLRGRMDRAEVPATVPEDPALSDQPAA